MDVKKEIEGLLRLTHREGIEDLIDYMEDAMFYDAPASTRHHGSEEGMLAVHSLNVYKAAIDLASIWMPKDWVTEHYDSIILVTILHDLGKAGQYGKPLYVPNILARGQSVTQPFKKNDELITTDHEIVSVIEASKYIRLTEDEQRAILWHNGLYGLFKYEIQGKEDELYMILHFADMWASRVMEV